jgi:hypothetical protein
MIQVLYDKLGLPDACHLGKRVFKKLFRENAQLGVTDKKAFSEDIDTIIWEYTLKPNTIAIQPYEDEHREYHEVAILQVNLKTLKRTSRIAEVIHRTIPYPLMVVFAFEATCAISLAHKRFSQAEQEAVVAEEFLTTNWIDLTAPTVVQQAFMDNLTITGLPQTHFFALYSALMDRCVALDCAHLTGEFHIETTARRREHRRQRLAHCHELEVQIGELKAAIKAESAFNRQVDLNTKIKTLECQLTRTASELLQCGANSYAIQLPDSNQ